MRIGLGQFNAVVGDLSGNAEKMRQVYRQALRHDVEVLLFPELAICGYPPEDLLLKKHFLQDNAEAIDELAADCAEATIIVGFAEGREGNCYNSAAVLQNGSVSKIYRKALLPNYGVFDERRYFQSGTEPLIVDLGEFRAAVTICEDIWDIEQLSSFLRFRHGQKTQERTGRTSQEQFQMVLNISAWPFYVGRSEQTEQMVRRCAKEFNCAVAYCNLVGGQDELVFDGRSMLVDSTGTCVAKARAFEEDLLIADVKAGAGGGLGVELVGGAAQQPVGRLDEIYQALVLGTRDYARKNGFGKVLLGLSGGIDSSVTAAIAAAALGAENVLGVTMPSNFSSAETRGDAQKLAENLGIRIVSIPIEPMLAEFDRSLGTVDGWDNRGVAYENLQARIRACILMSLSNQFGSLVLTTGNKSEVAVGYSTLYGDTAGGFAVLKDVPKTTVYKLAGYINDRATRAAIPADVISRAPSAELRANQKDTDTLPDYDLLDEILRGYVEQDKSAQELAESGLPAEVVYRVVGMVDRSEYKRRQLPPGPRITPRAFGKDRRLPITNCYNPGSARS